MTTVFLFTKFLHLREQVSCNKLLTSFFNLNKTPLKDTCVNFESEKIKRTTLISF